MNVDDVGTMALAVSHGMGLARMPCYVGDTDPSLRRLDVPLTPSTWGIWILSHTDLRSTARVRVAREFLVESIEGQREDGEPLNIGRKTRTVPTAIKRALIARDKSCAFPGCHHTRFVDAHHIEHWSAGGEM